jgi:predicted outer membrane repeat protein
MDLQCSSSSRSRVQHEKWIMDVPFYNTVCFSHIEFKHQESQAMKKLMIRYGIKNMEVKIMSTRLIDKTTRFVLAVWLLLGMLLVQFGPAAPAAQAATPYVVTNLNDSGLGSLRQAILDANANPGEDTITFSVSDVIELNSTLPTITDPAGVLIDGSGQNVAITTNEGSLVLHVGVDAAADISYLNFVSAFGLVGGGIRNDGTMNLSVTTFSGFISSTLTEAAVYNGPTGFLGVGGSDFRGNRAGFDGSAIINVGTAVVSANFHDNVSDSYGGAILNVGMLEVVNSTFSGNHALSGGAIYNDGTLKVANSTFSGNSAVFFGGANYNAGTLEVTHSTFSDNSAGFGGAISNVIIDFLILKNSLVSNNTPTNCYGPIGDGGGNLSYPDTSCPGINADPLLGPLQSNLPGWTFTHALPAGSPAVDAALGANCLATDQRGILRPQGTGCDIGAYELVVDNNAGPIVGPITAPQAPHPVNMAISAYASFSDPNTDDIHTALWDWGDGSTSAGVVNEANGTGTADGTHVYASAGVYTILLTVIDDDGAYAQSVYQYVVVYDPNGGFVTGAGSIWSAAGTCQDAGLCDPAAEGRARFGFVSRYQQGASVPTGNTHFRFQAGGLDFDSEAYEWLVVNQGGGTAQFKGSGQVNGDLDPNGNAFKFMVWATDGSPDTFRIRIWWEDESGEHGVYDNGFNQTIDHGRIVVQG